MSPIMLNLKIFRTLNIINYIYLLKLTNLKMKKIVILTGPTATGKTELSIELAKRIDGEIVSADSMMVYRYMDIGTAKPSVEERQGIKHHLIDVVYPDEKFSAKDFIELADKAIEKIAERGKIPIVVGGTWLYIDALLYGLSDAPEGDWKIRKDLYRIDSEKLYRKLLEVDPEYVKKIHPNDKKRIIRALEVFLKTGKPFSFFQKEHSFKEKRYRFVGFCLMRNREEIMDRIEKRVNKMIEKGLIEETKKLIDMGYEGSITSMQAIGYKELVPYIKGFISLDEAVNTIVKNTKSFAKRQIRKFRKKDELININLSHYKNEEALSKIIEKVEKEVQV